MVYDSYMSSNNLPVIPKYFDSFELIRSQQIELKKSSIGTFHLVQELALLNLYWENYQFDFVDPRNPNLVADLLVYQASQRLLSIRTDLLKFGVMSNSNTSNVGNMESMHQNLFEHLWTQYDDEAYSIRIQEYIDRLLVNKLNSNFFRDKYVLDLGCGHGNFLQACSSLGAKKCIGIDFGSKSIEYAKKFSKDAEVLEYEVGNVYNLAFENNTFDFVIQNGVFHHIDDEDKAYKEAHRVLKKGGQMWIYTDGGGIRGDLWDSSREILSDIPFEKIRDTLKTIGFSQSKCYHISDGLNAVYRHTTLEEIKDRLSRIGFGMFKRLEGGKWYDLDGKFLTRNFANEIAGDGDIRLLVTKI